MHELERAGVALGEVDAGNAGVVYLLEKLLQVRAPLVPHPRFGEEAAARAALEDARRKVYVLAEAHFREAAKVEIRFAAHAHVERARVELIEFLLAAAYAARGEEGGHGVVDGLLHRRERRVRPVGPAESIARLARQFRVHRREIIGRHHHVRVEDKHILALGAFHAVVARLPRPGVFFREIMHVQPVGIFLHNVFAGHLRPVLHNDCFKAPKRLCAQAFQQFVHFGRPIEYGNDKRVFHICGS